MWKWWSANASGPQFNGLAIVAAGLLTYGRLDMAGYILANLPPHRMEMDTFAGSGNVLAFRIAASLLPLPERLRSYMEWYDGSPVGDEVRQWFATHRLRLAWDAERQQFRFAAGREELG